MDIWTIPIKELPIKFVKIVAGHYTCTCCAKFQIVCRRAFKSTRGWYMYYGDSSLPWRDSCRYMPSLEWATREINRGIGNRIGNWFEGFAEERKAEEDQTKAEAAKRAQVASLAHLILLETGVVESLAGSAAASLYEKGVRVTDADY